MKYLENIALGVVLAVAAFCLPTIYGNGLLGFVVLMAFTFLGILIVIAVNHSGILFSNSLTTSCTVDFLIYRANTTFHVEINEVNVHLHPTYPSVC